MPFPTEHSARLIDPADFDSDSFSRITRAAASFDGREYGVILGDLTETGESADHAFRYPIVDWPEADARDHAEAHDAILFEPAEPALENDDDDGEDDPEEKGKMTKPESQSKIKPQSGASLGSHLNEIIDRQTTEDRPRSEIIEDMADEAGISTSTVNQILNGEPNCPPLPRLEGFARALDEPVGPMRTAAESDGCDYSGSEDSVKGKACSCHAKVDSSSPAPSFSLPNNPVWAIDINALKQIESTWAAVSNSDVKSFMHPDMEDMHIPKFQRHGPIAIIKITGPITKDAGFFSWWFGGSSTLVIMSQLQDALDDDTIHSIVLSIDSPGGSVDGLAELGDMLIKAREQKPIIAQTDGMAASAAYYIASQATVINSHRTDLIGSIGTRMVLFDTSKMFEAMGVRTIVVDTGEHKSTGVEGTEITDDQVKPFQDIVDFYFEDFLSAILRGRSISEGSLRALSDGRVFASPVALGHGLIDTISTLQETIDVAMSTADADLSSSNRFVRAKSATENRARRLQMQKLSQDNLTM